MIKLSNLINKQILNEYSDKVISSVLDTFKKYSPEVSDEEIKKYIDLFDKRKNNIRNGFDGTDTKLKNKYKILIPNDLQPNLKYLDITLWKDWNAFKKVVDNSGKKEQDVWEKAISKLSRISGIDAMIVGQYLNRFKMLIPRIEQGIAENNENVTTHIPKELLADGKWKIPTNWNDFDKLEHLVDSFNTGKSTEGAKELNSAETDADKVYSKNGVEIYVGDAEHKCVRYGKDGYYSWCVSRPKGGSLYYSYRFKEGERTFYIVFDKNLTDKKTQGHFDEPFHAVFLQVLKGYGDSLEYQYTTADNKGEFPHPAAESWSELGDAIKEDKGGKAFWEKIKGLQSVFKYVPPSGEEKKFKEFKNKRYTLEQYLDLSDEDQLMWRRSNADIPGIIGQDIIDVLDDEQINDLINHGRLFTWNEIKHSKPLIKRYADFRATRDDKKPLPLKFIPYLKPEIQEVYYKNFNDYFAFEDLEAYFGDEIVKKSIKNQLKSLGYLPKSAVKYMDSKEKYLYNIYSKAYEDIQEEETLQSKEEWDNKTSSADDRYMNLPAISNASFNALVPQEQKQFVNLVKKLAVNKDNLDKYPDFFIGVPSLFTKNNVLFFLSREDSTSNRLCLWDENGRIVTGDIYVKDDGNPVVWDLIRDNEIIKSINGTHFYSTNNSLIMDYNGFSGMKYYEYRVTDKKNQGKYLSKEQMFGSALNERLKHLIQYRAGIIK